MKKKIEYRTDEGDFRWVISVNKVFLDIIFIYKLSLIVRYFVQYKSMRQ